MVEYDFDVTRGVVSIVVNGVMFRYPNIRFITVHSGGTVPMLAGRMNDRIPPGAESTCQTGCMRSCASGTTTSPTQASHGRTPP